MDNGNEAAPAPAKKGLVIDFSWLKPWRLTPVRLAVLMAVVALGLGVLPFIKGAFYPGKHEGDTFQLADLAYRVALGEWPHLDFMTPIGYLALITGLWLWLGVGISGPWMHAKLLLVVGLVGYNHYCRKLLRDFINGSNTRSHVWFRWFNEIPVVVLLAVIVLVVLKPF